MRRQFIRLHAILPIQPARPGSVYQRPERAADEAEKTNQEAHYQGVGPHKYMVAYPEACMDLVHLSPGLAIVAHQNKVG